MSYTRVNWQNSPNTSTPLSAENLNKMDAGIKQNADDIETLQQHTYDAALNSTSTNAPQTKAVKEAIDNVIEEATVLIDPTLSNEGQAADAKATGDAVADVKSAIDALKIVDTASGAIASFPDGANMPIESLTVELEPIQDLHGQDAPYPGGGGENLFDESTVTIGKWWTNSGNLSNNAPYACISADIPVTGGETYGIKCFGEMPYSMSIVEFDSNGFLTRNHASSLATKVVTLSANTSKVVVQFAAGGDASTPMTAEILASYQAIFHKGSTAPDAYSPYSNICPITGRDSVTVTRTGKNLWSDADFALANFTLDTDPASEYYGLYVGYARMLGYSASSPFTLEKGGFIRKTPIGGTVAVSLDVSGIGSRGYIRFYYEDGTNSGTSFVISSEFVGHFSCRSNQDKSVSAVNFITIGGSASKIGIKNLQIERSDTETTYEPSNIQSVTIPLGQTVYGGTVDVTAGKLMVDRALHTVSDASWSLVANTTDVFRGIFSDKANFDAGLMASVYATVPRETSVTGMPDNSIKANNIASNPYRQYVYVRDSRFTTAADFAAAQADVQISFELNEPITITIDPATMSTLKGDNNVWSDAGDVSVEYVADPKLYIARLTEPDADMVADANITSGSYFIVNNKLFLATANIANGGAVIPGTNCTETNLAAALNALASN